MALARQGSTQNHTRQLLRSRSQTQSSSVIQSLEQHVPLECLAAQASGRMHCFITLEFEFIVPLYAGVNAIFLQARNPPELLGCNMPRPNNMKISTYIRRPTLFVLSVLEWEQSDTVCGTISAANVIEEQDGYSHSWRTPHKVFAWLISNKSRAHFFLIVSAQRHGVEQVNLSIWKRDEMVEQLSDLTKTEVDPIDLSVSHRLRETNPTHHHRRNCHPVINPPRASSRVGGCGQISLGEHLICSPKWHTDKWSITPTWE